MPSNLHIDDARIGDFVDFYKNMYCYFLQLLIFMSSKRKSLSFQETVIIINTVSCIDLQVNMSLAEVMMVDGSSGRNELAD